jgi:hypothetical protein
MAIRWPVVVIVEVGSTDGRARPRRAALVGCGEAVLPLGLSFQNGYSTHIIG